MYYRTFVGLDVHESSVTAATFSPETGEITGREFIYGDERLVTWLHSLEGPVRVVYESGFCGFSLYRELEREGIDCVIAAVSKTAKPSGDKVKTDKRDARFLARQLAVGNIVAVSVPSLESEGLRDLSRLREDAAAALTAAKHRVTHTVFRYGFRWHGGNWTLAHVKWLQELVLPTEEARLVMEHLLSEVTHLENEKKKLEKEISRISEKETLKPVVNALCMIKGISIMTAFCIVAETCDFTRFKKAAAFSAYLGLVPSESSSGKSVSRGRITRTGNGHVRKALTEAAWCISRSKTPYKKQTCEVPAEIADMARNINSYLLKRRRRLCEAGKKKPCIANTATARCLAEAVWAIARAAS